MHTYVRVRRAGCLGWLVEERRNLETSIIEIQYFISHHHSYESGNSSSCSSSSSKSKYADTTCIWNTKKGSYVQEQEMEEEQELFMPRVGWLQQVALPHADLVRVRPLFLSSSIFLLFLVKVQQQKFPEYFCLLFCSLPERKRALRRILWSVCLSVRSHICLSVSRPSAAGMVGWALQVLLLPLFTCFR